MKHLPKHQMDVLISDRNSNEYFNVATHSLGFVLTLALMLWLMSDLQYKSWEHLLSAVVYPVTLALSFLASTVLHFALLTGRYYRVLGIVDHNMIYLLIAGSYTPFCLLKLPRFEGLLLLTVVWVYALIWMVLKAFWFVKIPKWLMMAGYLFMGWLALPFLYQFFMALDWYTIILLVIGGLAFTVGALIFYFEKPKFYPPHFGNHEVWHLLVFVGNFLMFAAIVRVLWY